ncbi:D-glycero-alpha-D-manno-heptose-1,7-bisphosphate 7-phosphatase [Caulobacter hibisci]|uniref:D,D-heptose 1,7-bisphosphate phosphatase n=1 Tax=Caulobacter hibisci TaxID=2035993 RepID=A0ABS0ST98_9CAUL|nr:HAD family hydrolase [Caulobacter hibisci]
MSALRPAVFLDRDGVLNSIVWRGETPASPRSPDELIIEPGAREALEALKAAGYLLLVVTNQPDVARGLMAGETLDAIHDKLRAALPVDAVAACRHDNADACACRKPKPGLVLDLAREHGVDLSRSWLVGDQARDVTCGQAAGCTTVLLDRPYNPGREAGADHTLETLAQAAALMTRAPYALTA